MKRLNLNYIKLIQYPILICLCLSFLIGCIAEQQDKEESISQEVTKPNKNMIYKFYKSKSAGMLQGQQMVEYIDAFDKIYAENDVTVIGTWYNVNDPSETYLMTAFKSDEHYTEFVDKMKTHEDYQRMSEEMEPDRLSIEAATLKSYNEN
jgi:hypothetical protein